jgi:hypothetical protein
MANFSGTVGGDTLVGGDESDYISDELGGADTLDGRGGNDTISVFRNMNMLAHTIRMNGGAGDDDITVNCVNNESAFIVDAGAGNDTLWFQGSIAGSATVVLGAGVDSVRLYSGHLSAGYGNFHITIADFQPGTGGDQIH